MIYNFKSLFEYKGFKAYSDGNGIRYFKPEDFEEFRKNQEAIGNSISIKRFTHCKSIPQEKTKLNKDYAVISDTGVNQANQKFTLVKASKSEKLIGLRRVKGYGQLVNGEWVALCETNRKLLLILLSALGLSASSLFGMYALSHAKTDGKNGLEFEGIDITDESEIPAIVDYTQIPGFYDITATDEHPYLRLQNPESNSVYFMYTITEYDKVIYSTKAIAPGKMVECNLLDILIKGTHNIKVTVQTFDIETEVECNGSSQDIVVTIE